MDKTMVWGLIRVFLVLLVVVPGAIYATRWYANRQTLGHNIRIKEVLSLGSNKALYVIEWEKKELLLGVTNQSITVLEQQTLTCQNVEEEV